MATFRITAPDGAEYEVTPPAGTNPSEAEVLAQVQAQAGAAPQGNALTRGYRKYIAEPGAKAVDFLMSGRDLMGDTYEGTPEEKVPSGPRGIGHLFPQTPIEFLAGLGTGAGGLAARGAGRGLQALARLTGGAIGGETGGQASGEPTGKGALIGGGGALGGEGLGAVGSKVLRSVPGAKARINEGQSQQLLDTIGRTNRVAREAIEAAPVSPLQHQPRTASAIKRGFESGAVEQAAGQRFGDVLDRVANAAGNPAFATPALQEAYAMMPALEQRLLGPVGQGGFTLQQAQQIRSWVGDPAFAQSTLGQGVRRVPQQRLWGEITQEIEGGLAPSPRALQLWQANNRAYAGTEALQEGLTERGAFINQPNRSFLNRSALSDYLARNEVDLRRRGVDFDALVQRVLGGGQPGTRDVLASGAGTAADAAMQSLGRGTNTGSMQALGTPLRTVFPGVGSQYTGRAPYTLPPNLQAILDVVLQRSGGAALDGQIGRASCRERV